MRALILCAITILICGCSINIPIKSVTRERTTESDSLNIRNLGSYPLDRDYEAFSVRIDRQSLIDALELESTVFINIFDCTNTENNFPATAFYADIPLDEGYREAARRLAGSSGDVFLRGYAPAAFSQRMSATCVRLTGGSYLGRRIESTVTPVIEATTH